MCIWHGKWPPWCLYSLFLHFLATGVSLCMWLKVENWYHHPHQQPGQQRQPVQDWYQWKLYRWHRSKDASKGPHDQHQAKVIFHTWWLFVKLNMFLDHYSCQAVRIYTWVNLNDGVKIIFDWNHFPGSTKQALFGKIAVTVISYEGCALFSDRTLVWDRNNVTAGGFMDVANAMERWEHPTDKQTSFNGLHLLKKCMCFQTETWHYRPCPFQWVMLFKRTETPQRRWRRLCRKLVLVSRTVESHKNKQWCKTDSFCVCICRSRLFYTGTIRDSVEQVRICVICSMDWRPLALNRFVWICNSYIIITAYDIVDCTTTY